MNRQEKSFGGLKRKSINESLLGNAQRAPMAGVVQIFLYPSVLWRDISAGEPGIYLGWAAMFMVLFLRLRLLRQAPAILQKPDGILKFRIWFGLSAQLIAFTWGQTCAHEIMHNGFTPYSCAILVACLGTMALYCASYPIDAANSWLFQALIILPVIVSTILFSEGAMIFGSGVTLYTIFCASMTLNLRRNAIKSLQHVEQIERLHSRLDMMVSSIDEAFVILGADGRCVETPSQRSKDLLGLDPTGRHVNEILRMEGAQAEENTNWYQTLFSDTMDFQIVAGLGPTTLDLEGGAKRLTLKFHAMRDRTDKLTGIVLTASDTTLDMLQKREIEQGRERAELILGVHDNRLGFRGLLNEFEEMIARLETFTDHDIEQLKFDLHTLKGNATLAGALEPGRLVHQLERVLRENPAGLPAAIADFARGYRGWVYSEQPTFEKTGLFEDRILRVSRGKLAKLVRRPQYAQLESDLSATDFGELFEPFANQVRFAAHASGKKARFEVRYSEREVVVEAEDYREVFAPFVHLFTNAVDHGIEAPEARLAKGKPEEGTISVSYREEPGWIVAEVRDDGGGINVEKLRLKLKAQGFDGVDQLAEKDVVSHIFDEGLSTRDQVTSLSGMGIGLGAVLAGVHRFGGRIEVTSTGPQGTTIQITLPRQPRKVSRQAS